MQLPTMQFREAKPSDLDFVSQHSISRGPKEYAETVDFVYALEHEGNILAVGGIKVLNPTTAWAWMDWTKFALDHTRTVYRVTYEWLDLMMKAKGITRLMAAVECDFEEAIRTVEHLGFAREFTQPMRNWKGNTPAYLYVRFAQGLNHVSTDI